MPTTVQLPGGDSIEFPDSMSDADINAAVKSHLAQTAAPAPAEQPGREFLKPGFTDLVVSNIPGVGALPDIGAAAVKASTDWLGQRLGGGEATASEPSWGDLYQQSLARLRAPREEYAAEHPVASTAAKVLGAATMAPEAAAARIASGIPAAVPSFWGQVGRGAAAGAVGGAATGVTEAAQDPNITPGGALRDVAWNTAAGTGTGAAVPPLVAALMPVVRPVARAIGAGARAVMPSGLFGETGILGSGSTPAATAAARAAADRATQDIEGGGPNLNTIQQQLDLTPGGVGPLNPPAPGAGPLPPGVPGPGTTQLVPGTRPMTIADVAGSNLGAPGLAGSVARMQGGGRQTAQEFMLQRDRGAPGRMLDDVNDLIANTRTNPALDTVEQIKASRTADANRLYDQANWTAPPGGAAPPVARQITDPDVAKVVGDSALLRNTMDRIRADVPGYGGMSYTDMPLLDQAYKAAGRAEQSASDAVVSHNFGQIRRQLGDALVKANPDYGVALKNYAQHSTSLQAIEDGQNFFNRTGPETSQLLSQYSPGDQRLFRIGAADTLAKQLNQGTPGANEALRVMGTGGRQEQVRSIFGPGPLGDAAYQEFMSRAQAENLMKQSQLATTGGSQTAGRLAEDMPRGGGTMAGVGEVGAGLSAAGSGNLPLGAMLVGSGAERISAAGRRITPAVAGELSSKLWSADPAVQRRFLQEMLALPPPVGPMLSLPAGSLAEQLVPQAARAAGTVIPATQLIRSLAEQQQAH